MKEIFRPTAERSNTTRTADRRWLPFLLVTAAAIASAFVPNGHVEGAEFFWSMVALVWCTVLLQTRLGRTSTAQLAGSLSYIAFVCLLVQAQGGVSTSGLFTLSLLPILWTALYAPRWNGALVTLASSVGLVWTSLLGQETSAVVIRKGLFWFLITAGITVSVHQLRKRFRRAISQRDITIAEAESLSLTMRRLTALRSPEAVLQAAPRIALELTAVSGADARRSSYFVVRGENVEAIYDDLGHVVNEAWPVSDHPSVARVVETLQPYSSSIDPSVVGPSIRHAVEASKMTFGAWIPVLHDGKLHGILAVAGCEQPIEGHLTSFLVSLGHVVELALDIAMSYSSLEALAGMDPLTGLSNRRGLALTPSSNERYVVISADLDGLKQVNDTLGHDAGDAALARFAEILVSNVRQGTTVARVGGDEFVIVLDDANIETGWRVTSRILSTLTDPVLGGMSASFGIASGGSDSSFELVMKHADQAMYEAKWSGGMRAAAWTERSRRPRVQAPTSSVDNSAKEAIG